MIHYRVQPTCSVLDIVC